MSACEGEDRRRPRSSGTGLSGSVRYEDLIEAWLNGAVYEVFSRGVGVQLAKPEEQELIAQVLGFVFVIGE
jgi:hypothetical protein